MRRLSFTEGVPFAATGRTADQIRRAVARVQADIRPTLPLLATDGLQFTLRNFVGSLRLEDGTLIDVSPKVDSEEDWVRATIELLSERVSIGGERLAGFSSMRTDLLGALAVIYAERLKRALERDGPLLLLEREHATRPALKGKLHISRWLRHVTLAPHQFPQSFDTLRADNDFSKAMALVASLLAGVAPAPSVRSSLTELAASLRPGCPEAFSVPPSVVARPFPPQWSVYRPAWSIVLAILKRSSLLRWSGSQIGLEVAVETWPLLEELLARSLNAASAIAKEEGESIAVAAKRSALLLRASGPGSSSRRVRPDGWLTTEDGRTIATFEAKYAPGPSTSEWPDRGHVFQALSTAAACSSPVAVLVYPELFPARWWKVRGFQDEPAVLACVGLGLYRYRGRSSDRGCGSTLLDLLSQRSGSMAELNASHG